VKKLTQDVNTHMRQKYLYKALVEETHGSSGQCVSFSLIDVGWFHYLSIFFCFFSGPGQIFSEVSSLDPLCATHTSRSAFKRWIWLWLWMVRAWWCLHLVVFLFFSYKAINETQNKHMTHFRILPVLTDVPLPSLMVGVCLALHQL